MVALPTERPVARPLAEIVTTAEFDEFQTTELVTSCVLPSLKVPVAVNCCVRPAEKTGFCGVMAIDEMVAAEIVSPVEAVTLPLVAVTVAVPAEMPVASPAFEIDAEAELELQTTLEVRSCVELSE
jgi:hypothetical protein